MGKTSHQCKTWVYQKCIVYGIVGKVSWCIEISMYRFTFMCWYKSSYWAIKTISLNWDPELCISVRYTPIWTASMSNLFQWKQTKIKILKVPKKAPVDNLVFVCLPITFRDMVQTTTMNSVNGKLVAMDMEKMKTLKISKQQKAPVDNLVILCAKCHEIITICFRDINQMWNESWAFMLIIYNSKWYIKPTW